MFLSSYFGSFPERSSAMLDLAVIILSYNTSQLTVKCLQTVFAQTKKIKFDVWVVDNNSSDDSVAKIKKLFPQIHLIESKENLGFPRGNNLALREASARYYLLLNSDTEILDGALDSLVEFMDREKFDIGSCYLVGPDGKLQPNVGELPLGWPLLVWLAGLDDYTLGLRQKLPSFHRQFEIYYQGEREVGWVSGSVMIISEAVYKKIGGLDEKIFMYGEDSEYCLRAKRAGFRVGWTDRARIKHLGGASSADPHFKQWVGEFKGLLYIYRKYYGILGQSILRAVIYLFVALRMIAFLILGKGRVCKTYAKVLASI